MLPGIARIYLIILFQSCPPFYRNRQRASTKRFSRSNSCSRAARRKCARISRRVQGVFPRDTFATLLLPLFFFPLLSSFSRELPPHNLLLLSLILFARRLIISLSLSYHSQLHLEPRVPPGIFHTRKIVFARDSHHCVYSNLMAVHYSALRVGPETGE